jgi:hypothetical protein
VSVAGMSMKGEASTLPFGVKIDSETCTSKYVTIYIFVSLYDSHVELLFELMRKISVQEDESKNLELTKASAIRTSLR